MAHHLVESFYGSSIAWADENDEGALVGQDGTLSIADYDSHLARALSTRRLDEFEYWYIERAARLYAESNPEEVLHREHQGVFEATYLSAFKRYFRSMKQALGEARAAFSGQRPLEEWEAKALDAGWKPPKGWSEARKRAAGPKKTATKTAKKNGR